MVITYLTVDTPIGSIWLAATSRGLFRVALGCVDVEALCSFFKRESRIDFRRGGVTVERAAQELEEYMAGKRKRFTCQYDLRGFPQFSKRVWKVTRKIPFGEVRTYSWVANHVGDPYALRAVGRALSLNPLPIFIPCHRVVGESGWIGGYSGGLSVKKWLLYHESGQGDLWTGGKLENEE